MRREEVARHQRTRLYGGMIESVSEHGYADTTVAQVIALAGVSRRAFYEQFANKEACFLATHDIVVARARKVAMDAWARERGWANRLHAACKALFDDIAASPKGPRLVLVDSLGVGPQARARMVLAGCTFERLVAIGFQGAPDKIELSPLTTRAIVGGIRHVAFTRVHTQREQELYTLTDEVLDWVEAYRSPIAARLTVNGLSYPPAVAPSSAAFLDGTDRRSRVLSAVIHLTLDTGYSELTDPQIAQFAGISTEAFHKCFPSKTDCFLTVLDEFADEALDAVKHAMQTAGSWSLAVRLAVATLIERFVANEALSRLAFIDIFEVGPRIVGRMARSIEAFISLLSQTGPEARRGPAVTSEALTGAIWGIVSGYVANGRLRNLPCLVDQITFIVLAPYVGAKAAIEAIVEARRSLDLDPLHMN
jgi:AcrR family transcriptional regulator